MLKKQMKALEKMCGGGTTKGNAFIKDGYTYVTDGCQVVVMKCEIPELVEKYPLHRDAQRTVLDFIESAKRLDVICAMPPVNELKEYISEHKLRRNTSMNNGMSFKVMDSNGVIHGMNPCRVREIYEALNIGKHEVVAHSRKSINPICFSSDEGMAMLLPVRIQNDGVYNYKGR